MKRITVVIPVRAGSDADITLRSLDQQTFHDFGVVIINDKVGNANHARNLGFRRVSSPFVLFADDDIDFVCNALEIMYDGLTHDAVAAYAYGSYEMGGRIIGAQEFDDQKLREQNYISTMSLIRTSLFPGFDESLQRLQDWDLWLSMLASGHRGTFCGGPLFRTERRDGITRGPVSYDEAKQAIAKKHNLAI